MRGEKKRLITQWLFPTIVLIAVIGGLLINFTNQSGTRAAEEVESDLIMVTQRYAAELYSDLLFMGESTIPVSLAISQMDRTSASLLMKLRDHSPAYLIVYSDLRGEGYSQTGERISLSQTDYFAGLLEAGNTYTYVTDDGITGAKAVVHATAIPNDPEHVLLAYYPIADMGVKIKEDDFDSDFFCLIMDSTGRILAHNEYASSYLNGENLIETLGTSYDEEIRKMDMRLKNGVSGSIKAVVDGEARTLIYTPFHLNQWTLVAGINQSYVDRAEREEWKFTRSTLFQLAIVICVFIVMVVLINLFNKMRNTENTKKLEEKADTDLLTGLNNKLATERKIKEFMETHPQQQSMMFVLDIDNFKKINDTMGHAFGDEVLRSLGQQITSMFRVTDIVGRVGGDEFIIILKNMVDDAVVKKEAEKVARFFHDFKTGEYVKYSATASIGVAIFPRDGKDFETIYKAADQALYAAKKRGKNQLAFYHDYLDAVVIDK